MTIAEQIHARLVEQGYEPHYENGTLSLLNVGSFRGETPNETYLIASEHILALASARYLEYIASLTQPKSCRDCQHRGNCPLEAPAPFYCSLFER